MLKGVDVSEHQGLINWDKLKGKIDYAILRAGYGSDILSQDDKYFKRNADECTRLKIPFGVYLYSYATTVSQAESEAKHVLRLIKGYKLDYPVYYDLEDEKTTGKQSNTTIAQIAQTFCKSLESNGYFVGVYANTYWFNTKLTDKIFNNYVRWVAEYNKECNYKGKYIMWQYTSKGQLDGIAGNIDMNYLYEDSITKSKDNIDVSYQVYAGGKWLPNVLNLKDYAGITGKPISGIYANLNKGNIKYRVYTKGKWLPWVVDRRDYAGILNSNIQGIQMQLLNLPGHNIKYRAYAAGKWLPWVTGLEDYAGILNKNIEAVQMYII